ncbi:MULTISPECIES: YceI family protein [Sphingomonas]|uniref:YceI family protein n=1 Tax=Sphingomonas TaxID=13687 RepID=UPI0015857854|nr:MULTISPECIES: YceI family protein [Sphingomonas]MBB4046517.1 polyisoprenoid-binding protein YceI [Sphingomonas zeae]MDK8214615.1 YceI family protein [Sphingomonas sp. UMB7805-LC452B]
MRIAKVVAVAMATLGTMAPASGTGAMSYTIDPAHARVQAKVGFFGLGSKTARFPHIEGHVALSDRDAKAVTLDVRIDTQTLEAGDALTRSRLRGPDFFDVDHYPRVTFHATGLTRTGPHSATVTGTISARGVTRPAMLAVDFSRDFAAMTGRESVHIAATTRIDRRDFGMTAYPLIVGRLVTIGIDADLLPVGG